MMFIKKNWLLLNQDAKEMSLEKLQKMVLIKQLELFEKQLEVLEKQEVSN